MSEVKINLLNRLQVRNSEGVVEGSEGDVMTFSGKWAKAKRGKCWNGKQSSNMNKSTHEKRA